MKPEFRAPPREVMAGLVARVTFHDDENGFCVLRAKARARRDLVTVVGSVLYRSKRLATTRTRSRSSIIRVSRAELSFPISTAPTPPTAYLFA